MSEAEVREMYARITNALIEKRLQISCMESCTSGLVASLITDTPGASAVLMGGYVTYSNREKIRLGVDASVIEEYSVYSKETALSMAAACREAFKSDIGVGVTGTMGRVDPANAEHSVPGELFFAINMRGVSHAFHALLPAMESRYAYKIAAAGLIAEELIKLI